MNQAAILSAAQVKAEAARLGFSACGLAPAGPVDSRRAQAVMRWLAEGKHGGMDYLARHMPLRLDPRRLVEGARTVVSVALNYSPARTLPGGYTLARYAYGQDYHDVVRHKLRQLMTALGADGCGRAFCDTAPVDERYWAWRCGLGWTGRSTQLIIPRAGSYFFLGELILTLPADRYDTPVPSRCGTCRRCIDACPTGALSPDGTLDARRCLSYLTIEHRGPLPPGAAARMGRCIYGCDRCAEACPWNRFASPTREESLQPRAALLAMTPAAWRALTVEQYRALFRGSAVKRAKYDGLLRNIRAVASHEATAGAGTPQPDTPPTAPSAPAPEDTP